MPKFDPALLATYPNQPGVYLMKDAEQRVLYVGKAKNLRARLKQYFIENRDTRKMIPHLIAQINEIDTIVSLNEKDALLLENNLIKHHKPKYNVLLKDDKNFVNLIFTKHKWPMLCVRRNKGKPKEGELSFGPYTNAQAARHTYDALIHFFPLRQCSDAELANRERPCLLYELKRCVAPCVGKCTEQEYGELVKAAVRVLTGQDKELIQELKTEMLEASERLEFERAGQLLRMIRHIEQASSKQHIDNPSEKDCDAIGLYREADALIIALLQFRNGKLIGSEHFYLAGILSEDREVLETFLLQYYPHRSFLPPDILLPLKLDNSSTIEEILSEKRIERVRLIKPKKGSKQNFLEMAAQNAKSLFAREQTHASSKEKILLDLTDTLGLMHYPHRIDCVDISNMGGTDQVGSICVFIEGVESRHKKRLFKLRTSTASDDYASMREVMRRHFTRSKMTGDLCDLLIIDGGKGHLNSVLAELEQLDIASIDVIALTKESARHDKGLSQEKIYQPHRNAPLLLDPRSQQMFFLQKIRDETHRSAIGYHRKKRSKRTMHSALDDLPGIGPIKKQKLLKYYGSIRGMQASTKEAMKEIKGLTKKDIEIVWAYLTKSSEGSSPN